jgi:hypothetical protein
VREAFSYLPSPTPIQLVLKGQGPNAELHSTPLKWEFRPIEIEVLAKARIRVGTGKFFGFGISISGKK